MFKALLKGINALLLVLIGWLEAGRDWSHKHYCHHPQYVPVLELEGHVWVQRCVQCGKKRDEVEGESQQSQI